MKKFWILVLAMLLAVGMTACSGVSEGTETTAEESGESSSSGDETAAESESESETETESEAETAAVIVESTAATTAETEEETEADPKELALSGQAVQLSSSSQTSFWCMWDLDADGEEEMVAFAYEGEAPYDISQYTLFVDGESVTETGESLTGDLYIISMDGETYQLLVPQTGASGDYSVFVWVWQDDTLQQIGTLDTEIENLYVKDGLIYCREISHIFQSLYVDMVYELVDGSFQEVKQDLYIMGNTLTLLQDLSTYSEQGGAEEDGPVLTAGSEVVVIGTDNEAWVQLLVSESGETCWLQVTDYCDLVTGGVSEDAQLYFDGLILTD